MPGEQCKHEKTWSVYSRTMRDALEVSGVHINFENLLTVNCTVKVDCVLICDVYGQRLSADQCLEPR